MSDVKERLINFAEAVMCQFELPEDDWEKVNEIIMENTLLEPTMTEHDVIKFFTEKYHFLGINAVVSLLKDNNVEYKKITKRPMQKMCG